MYASIYFYSHWIRIFLRSSIHTLYFFICSLFYIRVSAVIRFLMHLPFMHVYIAYVVSAQLVIVVS